MLKQASRYIAIWEGRRFKVCMRACVYAHFWRDARCTSRSDKRKWCTVTPSLAGHSRGGAKPVATEAKITTPLLTAAVKLAPPRNAPHLQHKVVMSALLFLHFHGLGVGLKLVFQKSTAVLNATASRARSNSSSVVAFGAHHPNLRQQTSKRWLSVVEKEGSNQNRALHLDSLPVVLATASSQPFLRAAKTPGKAFSLRSASAFAAAAASAAACSSAERGAAESVSALESPAADAERCGERERERDRSRLESESCILRCGESERSRLEREDAGAAAASDSCVFFLCRRGFLDGFGMGKYEAGVEALIRV